MHIAGSMSVVLTEGAVYVCVSMCAFAIILLELVMLAKPIQINRQWMSKPSKKGISSSSFYMKGNCKAEFRRTIIIDFSPLQGYVRQQMKDLQQSRSIVPTYNADNLIFTPTFRLPSVEVDEEHYEQKFMQKMQQCQQIDIDEIIVPRPKNKDYCNVCELKFDDYNEHSLSDHHGEQLAKNKFQRRIKRLCQRYYQRHLRKERRERAKSCSDSQGEESLKAEAIEIKE